MHSPWHLSRRRGRRQGQATRQNNYIPHYSPSFLSLLHIPPRPDDNVMRLTSMMNGETDTLKNEGEDFWKLWNYGETWLKNINNIVRNFNFKEFFEIRKQGDGPLKNGGTTFGNSLRVTRILGRKTRLKIFFRKNEEK